MRLLIVDQEIIAGGVETLRLQLLPELASRCESVVWVLPARARKCFEDRLTPSSTVKLEDLAARRGSAAWLGSAVARRLPPAFQWRCERALGRSRLGEIARRHRSTHALTTCVFNQPPMELGVPTAGFICDLNPALAPSTRENMLRWVERADAIFGISEFTCAELRRLAPRNARRINSVPLAARSQDTSEHAERLFDFYYPAAPNPHKGHTDLLEAVQRLASDGTAFRIGLSGAGTDGLRPGTTGCSAHCDEIQRYLMAHADMLQGRVQILGDVSATHVSMLYRSSSCIVLPSRYEGFGLPLAEALSLGKAVICSDIPAFREQLNRYRSMDRARVVPPGDSSALAEAMKDQLRSPILPLPKDEINARLASWTWSDAAGRCFQLLAELG